MQQKGVKTFICFLFFHFLCSNTVESATLRATSVHDHSEQVETEEELALLRQAAARLTAFCQSLHNETADPKRGVTGIASDEIPDPTCTRGVVSPDLKVCCAKGCGLCGEHKLCNDPGKYNEVTGKLVDECCYGRVMKSAPSCDKDHPPCVLSPDYKETLKKWKQVIPDRHAMQDCNKAIPIARDSHGEAIDKGHFLAELYLNGETKYKEALRIAEDVAKKCDKKIAEGEEKTAEAKANIAKATKADEVKNPLTGRSKMTTWKDAEAAGTSATNFYKQIKTNAEVIVEDAKKGLANVHDLRTEAAKVSDVAPLQLKLEKLIADAETTYEEALKLWQQWEDSSKDYDCGAPPDVKNAETTCADGNTKFSPTCEVKCAKGYDGNGTANHLRCQKIGKFGEQLTGDWTGMATCVGRECGVPPHIKHSDPVLTNIRYPEVATYTCHEGFFTPSGNVSFNVPCAADGHFQDQYFETCKGVKCGEAPVHEGTKPVKGTFIYGEEANYTCLEGYTLDGMPGGRTYFHTACTSTGKFTHSSMGCQKVRCGPVPSFSHTTVTHLTTEDTEDQHYGDKADYHCEPGYTTDRTASGPTKFTLVCHADGEFSLEGSEGDSQMHQPRCLPICIGMPPKIPHGQYVQREMCYGDKALVTAEIGYSTKADPDEGLTFSFAVSASGQFEGIKDLLPVKCGVPPEVVKATTTFGKKSAVYPDVVAYDCAKGYSTDKSKDPGAMSFTIQCGADGVFSPLPALGKCANIDDCVGHTCGPHGSCVDHLMNYTCACQSGYGMTMHPKTKELVCGNINDCGPEACGVGKCIDEVNSYKCDCPDGYHQVEEMHGAKAERTCYPVTCGSPEKCANAFVEPADKAGEKLFYGATVQYHCAPGHTIDGKVSGKDDFSVDCLASKKFSEAGNCLAITCADIPEEIHPDAAAAKTSAKFNESVEFTCAKGYTLDGDADGEKTYSISCQASGEFTVPQHTCQKVSCGEPPDVSHAHHAMVEVLYKGTSEYSCFSGFSLDGKKDGKTKFTAECKDDGNFGGIQQCLPKVCGDFKSLDPIQNSVHLDFGQVYYPMSTEFFCLDGYTVDGSPDGNESFSVACLASGEFAKYDPKQCKPVVCGLPPKVGNTTIKSSTKMVFGDHVTYQCDPGFTSGGEWDSPATYEVACLSSGHFSSPTPDMLCRNVNDCENHTCGQRGTCVDLIGPPPAYTCDCDYGFKIMTSKDGEKHCGEIDDCKGVDCGVGTCKDLIGGYSCTCPGGYYLALKADGSTKTCSPVTCSELVPKVENGKLFKSSGGTGSGAVKFPATLTYQCDQGYSVDSTPAEARRKFQVQCKADGQLHGLAECQPISCGTAPVIEHTSLVSPDSNLDSVDYKSEAKYKCDDGYTILGKLGGDTAFEITCKDDGHLTDSKVCDPVICGTAPTHPNSKAAISGEMHFGQEASYACNFGYTVEGTPGGHNEYTLSCLANGSFSSHGTHGCKPISATIPEMGNAYLLKYAGEAVDESNKPTKALFPNTLTFKCKDGYTFSGLSSGDMVITARVDWQGKFVPSLPTECTAITYVIHGRVQDAPTASNLDGVKVYIKDRDGEVLTANGHFVLTGVVGGEITVLYHKDGYINGENKISLAADVSVGGPADIAMSPVLAADAWRATLKWGVAPRDLDTYGMWYSFKSCWYQKTQEGLGMRARLEHDDTDSYGPETLHLSGVGKCEAGAYFCNINYRINDYTETGMMKNTDVKITLYNGDRIAGTWNIADCQDTVSPDGNWWHVFRLDGMTNKLIWNCKQGVAPVVEPPPLELLQTGHSYENATSLRR